uniref:Uncharacterized protein n=1 Tax=Anopheles coluzzii TaxID=1518534 RepID=A0A6E8WBX6_ANOCL|nr:uncharacterized protein LOC120960207 isoform X2 [Anopheles coluzzii]
MILFRANNMCYYHLIILWLTVLIYTANSIWVVEINKLHKSCENPSKRAPFPLDMSKVQIYLSEEDKLVLNGEVTFTQDIFPPWGISIYTHKLDHGEWTPTAYTKSAFNLCLEMHASHEIWYIITKQLNKTNCPYRKGYVEKFDMVDIGSFGFDDVLQDLVGDWRIFVDFRLGSVPHKLQISCMMYEISILEH